MKDTSATIAAATAPDGRRVTRKALRAEGLGRSAYRRAVLATGAALICLAVVASAPAAAPSYTGWSEPVNLGLIVNASSADQTPTLSADGLSLYLDSDRSGGVGGRDLWVAQRPTTNAPWGAPANVGATINTASAEIGAAFSTDGHWMFFSSNRAGGFGNLDLYQSYRANVHDDFGWQTPTNLGANVNVASDDTSPSYFENAGHPQLFYGSARTLVGGPARPNLFLSSLQPDGTWGLGTVILELSSPGLDLRPAIRGDGLEIVLQSDREGSAGPDLWSATRTSVDAPWTTPVNLGPSVNTTGSDTHPFLSADGRTILFASDRAPTLGGADLWMTTRDARLTVTANNHSRLFGQPNPPLTYAITGFVGGETTTVISGAAACTTTATPFSPAGLYPITCSVGTLSAAGNSFATFAAGTLTVGYTNPCLTGPRRGPLTVSAGQAVCIGAGANQTGPVTVAPGGSLDIEGGRITGPVNATGATSVRICGATLTGPVTITGSISLVLVGGDVATGPCDPNTITGPVTITGNTGGVEFNGNTVVGPVRITGNTGNLPPPDTGAVHAAGNTVLGQATIQP